jgi:hypothetical protein
MQFKVPQFIDIEDKVIGPFTFRQFVYLAGGAALIYMSFKFLGGILGFLLAVGFGGLALALTFYKYNDKPFINVFESFIKYYLKSRLYIWHKQLPKKQVVQSQNPTDVRATLTESKLKTLSWSLDVIDTKK